MILVLLISILVGVLLLVAVFNLPTEKIYNNVSTSVATFNKEGTYPVLTSWCTSQLDNYSDALMFEAAIYNGNESTLNKAMMVYHVYYPNKNQAEALIAYYSGDQAYTYMSYARYWHGYLLLIKPLLTFMTYSTIRVLNLVVQTLLSFLLLFILWKKNMVGYIIPYVLTLLLLMPLATAFSLQFSAVFYLTTIGSIVLLLNNENWVSSNRFLFFFLMLGILTSYFDFLTYPLVTFGVPMTFYLCLSKETSLIRNIGDIIKYLWAWGFGYVGMWAGKWLVGSLLTGQNLIADAITQMSVRTSMSNADISTFSYYDVIYNNIESFSKNPTIYAVFGFLIVLMIIVLIRRRFIPFLKYFIIFGIIAMLPFIWYVGASNHSYIHHFFTHKELVITAFAAMCMLVKAATVSMSRG